MKKQKKYSSSGTPNPEDPRSLKRSNSGSSHTYRLKSESTRKVRRGRRK